MARLNGLTLDLLFADAGYFIGLLNPGDELHARAKKWSLALREPLLTTEYVLVEVFDYFSRPADRFRSHQLLQRLRNNSRVEIVPASPELFQKGVELHAARGDKEWSLTDCFSFVVMQERSVSRALAYDHHFEQAGFEALLRREP